MEKIPFPVKVNLPISENFANFLFQGRAHTQTVDGIHMLKFGYRSDFTLPGTTERYFNTHHFLEKTSHKATAECKKEHNREKCGHMRASDVFFWIVSGSDIITGRFYGIWNDLGPQFVAELIQKAQKDKSTINFINSLIKKLKEIDAILSGEPHNIGNRIKKTIEARNAREGLKYLAYPLIEKDRGLSKNDLKHIASYLEGPDNKRSVIELTKPYVKRRPIPQDVLKSIANFVGKPENKTALPSAPLARLFKNNNNTSRDSTTTRRGGAIRNKTRRHRRHEK